MACRAEPDGGSSMCRPAKEGYVSGLIFVGIGMAVVVVILILGLSTLFVEGAKARSWSNRLMRMRVLAQFVTILIMLAVFYFAHK